MVEQNQRDTPIAGHYRRVRRAVLCLVGAALLTATMLLLSHLPNDRVPAWVVNLGDDKARHLLAYAAWAALLLRGTKPWWPRRGRALLAVTCLAAAFAALDEWTQPWSGRTCSVWDFSASVLGAVLGCAMILGWELFLDGVGPRHVGWGIRSRSEPRHLPATPTCPNPSDHMPVH